MIIEKLTLFFLFVCSSYSLMPFPWLVFICSASGVENSVHFLLFLSSKWCVENLPLLMHHNLFWWKTTVGENATSIKKYVWQNVTGCKSANERCLDMWKQAPLASQCNSGSNVLSGQMTAETHLSYVLANNVSDRCKHLYIFYFLYFWQIWVWLKNKMGSAEL